MVLHKKPQKLLKKIDFSLLNNKSEFLNANLIMQKTFITRDKQTNKPDLITLLN